MFNLKTFPKRLNIELSQSKKKQLKKIALLGCKAKVNLVEGKLEEGYHLLQHTASKLKGFISELKKHIPTRWAEYLTLKNFSTLEGQYSQKLGLPKKLAMGSVLGVMLSLPAMGQVVSVTTTADENGNGADTGTSLREAILQANANAGDYMIYLPSGTYTLSIGTTQEDAGFFGDLDIHNNGSLSIICTGTNTAVIDANQLDRVFHIQSATVNFSNITIQNGFVMNQHGGGIYNQGGSLTISNSLITKNEVTGSVPNARGAGLYNTLGATVDIQNSTFSLNSAVFGGAIFNSNNSSVVLSSSSIIKNTGQFSGGGIINNMNSHVTLNSSSILENTTDSAGGGVFNSSNSTITLNYSTLSNNIGNSGAGIYNTYNSTIILNSSSLTNNIANVSGGGILNDKSNVILNESSLIENTAQSLGGGILNQANSTILVNSSSIVKNTAVGRGGGVFNYGDMLLSTSFVTGNTADIAGGGIYNSSYAMAYVEHSVIAENSGSFRGGGIVNNNSTLIISSSSITQNTASHGGGVQNANKGMLTINTSLIARNTATNSGGGVYSRDNSLFTLSSSSITENIAANSGGGVFTHSSQFISSASSITGNMASSSGGGVFQGTSTKNTETTLKNTTISGNSATNGGAIFLTMGEPAYVSALNLTHVTIAENTGTTGGIYINQTNGIVNFTAQNNIIAGNGSSDFAYSSTGGSLNLITSGQINLIQNTTVPNISSFPNGTDPQLADLQVSSGSLVHPLYEGSVALNAASITGVTTDQRGVLRNDGTPDLGAFEGSLSTHKTFVVTTGADLVDANIGDGICDDGSGECTLRAAIQESNALVGNQTIYVQDHNFHQLTIGGISEDSAVTGDLDIVDNGSISIICTGTNPAVIDANQLDRVFHIQSATVSFSNITIQNGLINHENGGGIYNQGGTLSLSSSHVINNSSIQNRTGRPYIGGLGGGIFSTQGTLSFVSSSVTGNYAGLNGGGIWNIGSATLLTTTISNNEASSYNGGGIFSDGNATLNIQSSIISFNVANHNGGGIYTNDILQIHSSTITNNRVHASYGGGIYAQGNDTKITNSSFTNNQSSSRGSAIIQTTGSFLLRNSLLSDNFSYTGATLNFRQDVNAKIHDSDIVSNNSAGGGGGIANDGVLHIERTNINNNEAILGGGINNRGNLTITYSDISNNKALYGGAFIQQGESLTISNVRIDNNRATGSSYSGGGILITKGTTQIENSSITNNISTRQDGGGISVWEDRNDDIDVTISNSTISGNSSNLKEGGGLAARVGGGTTTITLNHTTIAQNSGTNVGGVYLYQSGGTINFTAQNSIIAGNGSNDFAYTSTGGSLNLITSGQINLVQNTTVPNISSFPNGTDPQLADLQVSSGSFVHPLYAGSVAVNAAIAGNITTDQRGALREDGNPDLGAFEGSLIPNDVTMSWVGYADTDWFNPRNWNTRTIPTASDVIYIPANTLHTLVIDEVVTCAKFITETGADSQVDTNAGGQLIVID